MSGTSGVEVRINGSELPYLRSRDSGVDEFGVMNTMRRSGSGSGGSRSGGEREREREEWNEDSFVEDYGVVIRGGDEFGLEDLVGPGPIGGGGKWDAEGVEGSGAEDGEGDGDGDGDGNATDGSESSLDLHTPLPYVSRFPSLFLSFLIFQC